jgi:hypothetical protein
MGAILSLVQPAISAETEQAVLMLLDMVRSGQLTGLAYVALLHGKEYSADSVGRCAELPAMTRGMLDDLGEEIGIKNR